MHMQGGQYSYRIKYEDIVSLFLLPKPDGQRMAFVISLDKPIRQGNQKYQHLIVETHKIETTISGMHTLLARSLELINYFELIKFDS